MGVRCRVFSDRVYIFAIHANRNLRFVSSVRAYLSNQKERKTKNGGVRSVYFDWYSFRAGAQYGITISEGCGYLEKSIDIFAMCGFNCWNWSCV